MAMIKGFQLKAVKNFRGHEGEPLKQGNLYFGNKKVGFVSEDSNGGYPTIDIDRAYREEWTKASELFEKEYPEKSISTPEETLFHALLEITENESTFKKAVKKGYSVVAHFDELRKYPDNTILPTGQQIMLTASNLKQVDEYEESDWKGKLYEKSVFTSLEDFIIS